MTNREGKSSNNEADTDQRNQANSDHDWPPPELIEQYKAYVDTTVDVSNRRMRNNRFYVVLLSGTLAVISVLAETEIIEAAGLFIAGFGGLILCILWYSSIISYKQLNTGKYDVIKEMEEELPFAPFSREWVVLQQGKNWRKYITHTRVERKIPGLLAILYFIVTVYAVCHLFW